jgi:hypothetical protein
MWIRVAIVCFICLAPHLQSVLAADQLRKTAPAGDLPAIACRFETSEGAPRARSKKAVREWYLWRQPASVETREAADDTSELWQRAPDGQISFQRIFHRDKRVIEYTTGDLRALNRYPDWSRLASVVDPAFLERALVRKGTVEVLGRRAERYTGRVGAVQFEVWWLAREQVPALLRQVSPTREVVVRLKSLRPLAISPSTGGRTAGYTVTDYSDIGDKENDAFLRKLHQH